MNVDDAARAAGYAGGCAQALTLFTGIIGAAASPEQAIERGQPGNYWACPTGTDHSQFLDFRVIGSSETQAAFVNAEYQINDQWLVSGGLRYTEDEKSQDLNGGVAVFNLLLLGPSRLKSISTIENPIREPGMQPLATSLWSTARMRIV